MLTESEPRAFDRHETKLALRELASFFYRQRLFLVVTALAIASVATGLTYLIAPVYTASGSIVVERTSNPLLRNQLEQPSAAPEMANDVANVMRSRPVIETVVDKLRPHERPRRRSAIRDGIEQAFATLDRWGILSVLPRRERYIRRWSRALKVEGNGDYVTVSLSDDDGALAASAINAIIEEYRNHYVELLRMRRALDLRQEIFAQTQSDILEHRRAALKSAAEQQASRIEVPSPHTLLSDSTGSLTANVEHDLRRLLAARARSSLISQAPAVDNANTKDFISPAKYNAMIAQLGTVRRKLDASDIQVRTLQLERGSNHSDTLLALETRASLRRAVADLEEELHRSAQAGAAKDEAEAFKTAYDARLDATRRRVDLVRLYTQSDTRTSSVRLAEFAETPNIPSSTRLLQVAIGLGAAIAFALCAAVIRDRVNLRIRDPQGIEAILQSPVLFAMSESRSQVRRLRR
ncbi:Wzz/FepE/Etk N-terminal domain-containing protein [Microvirga guangxiensis]|uniref:Uncharacterized protein involved in exopolysaccharide biosynthesis n=1 Tax=Microvirga guangxiensis TaxID=549386 RepID=A0A1G5GZE5_9HYPH|nr:Wzz/FepE/Etk N-terminal domain-containing protein [Microvirga guangxiensis]SCY56854.1 Uncharacterized protein involved in exopolysaccharide biosynthesis [Microvirga guangxiensis]